MQILWKANQSQAGKKRALRKVATAVMFARFVKTGQILLFIQPPVQNAGM